MRKLTELVRRFTNWCSMHKVVTALMMAVLILGIPLHYTHAGGELFTQFLSNPLDTTALTLAGVIQYLTGAIGRLVLTIIQMVVIPVLGYNGFYNSHITNLGWSLVRDVVNMFVVVILMVIAIMTIIGYSAANWTQQLPKLFIAIVLVNFSKLICGFLIDVSQVIMFTFVNAIVSIAAGNFASMLSLNTFGQFGSDFIEKVNASGSGTEPFQFLIAAYLQFIVLLGILGVMFLLAVAFVWRIVVLWILIIMAPLAFFMIGVKDVFHAADSSYKQWWGKFSSALTFGPMMVFFLWLALAASSGSNLAQTEDFPMPESTSDAGIPLEMFDMKNFLGMFLALAILLAGMQQASSAASGIGGWASSMLSEDMGKGLLKGIARPFNSSKRLGKAAFTGGKVAGMEVPGLAKIAPGYTQKFGKGLANVGTSISAAANATPLRRKLGGALVAGTLGAGASAAGAFVAGEGKNVRKERNKAGAEIAEHMTDDQKTAYNLARADVASGDVARVARGQGVLAQYGNEVHGARMKELVTKEKAQKTLREDLEKDYKNQINPATKAKYTDAEAKDAAANDYNETMRKQLAFASSDEGKAFLQLSGEEKDSIDDTKTANPHLIEPKGGKAAYQDKDGKWENEAGYNADKRKAIADHFQTMEDKKRLNVGAISALAFSDDNARAALEGFRREGKDGKKMSLWTEMESGKGTIAQRKAITGMITAANVSDAANGPRHVASLVNAKAVADKDADGKTTRRDAVLARMNTTNAGGLDPSIHGAASAALLDSGDYNTDQVFGGAAFETLRTADEIGNADISVANRVGAMLSSDAKSARYLDAVIPEGTEANAGTELVVSGMNRDVIRRLENSRVNESGTPEGKQSEAALVVMKRAVEAEERAAIASGNNDRAKKMKEYGEAITTANRYGGTGRGGRGRGGSGGGGPTTAEPNPATGSPRINPRFLSTPGSAGEAAGAYTDAGGAAGSTARATAAAEGAARVSGEPIGTRYTPEPPTTPPTT